MGYTNPTVTDFQQYFVRDFPYGSDPTTVMDSDILNAITLAAYNINPGLFADQGFYTINFLLLSAHYLVTNLRNSSQGIAGQFPWMETSKSVGSVSTGITIPDRILENPELAMLTKTNYGALYLQNILPFLVGPGFTVCGTTLP